MKPFLHGKKTLDAPPLRPPPGLHATLAAQNIPAVRPPTPNHAHNPTVETVKEGDKVVRLVITCGCGERIEVECLYPAGH
jgi:hypothetical protein